MGTLSNTFIKFFSVMNKGSANICLTVPNKLLKKQTCTCFMSLFNNEHVLEFHTENMMYIICLCVIAVATTTSLWSVESQKGVKFFLKYMS